jgi:hypothetical protein
MRTRSYAVALAAVLTYPNLCAAGAVNCISSTPQANGAPQVGQAAGTVVGIIVGAYATDGDVTITMLSGDIGCSAGSALGKAYNNADNSAMMLNGKIYGLLHQTPQQGIIEYLSNAPATPQTPPSQAQVIPIDPVYNLVVVPLASKTLHDLGLPDKDIQTIATLAQPPTIPVIQQQAQTIAHVLGFSHF